MKKGKAQDGLALNATKTETMQRVICLPPQFSPVLAVDDGKVMHRANFYLGTDELAVDHGKFVVRYGEVDKVKLVKGIKSGEPVTKGQIIADVGRLKMLHFEMYQGTETGPLTQKMNFDNYKYLELKNFQRRPYLIDPTPYLDQWKLWSNFSKWVGDVVDDVF